MRFGLADGARRGPNSRDSLRRKSFIKRTGTSYCASRFRSAKPVRISMASFTTTSEALADALRRIPVMELFCRYRQWQVAYPPDTPWRPPLKSDLQNFCISTMILCFRRRS